MPVNPPPYEEWAEYCMTRGHAVFSFEIKDEREEQMLSIEPETLVGYYLRLLEASSSLSPRYSDEQIGRATWFLFGCGSGYFWTARKSDLASNLPSRSYRALATMYTQLFDRVCNRHATDIDVDLTNELPLDTAVYMIWDMDGGVGPYPADDPAMEPALEALQHILLRCITSTCLISALHGLGHIAMLSEGRVGPIIEKFLTKRPQVPAWVRENAERARTGHVQ